MGSDEVARVSRQDRGSSSKQCKEVQTILEQTQASKLALLDMVNTKLAMSDQARRELVLRHEKARKSLVRKVKRTIKEFTTTNSKALEVNSVLIQQQLDVAAKFKGKRDARFSTAVSILQAIEHLTGLSIPPK